jgi:redox-sensing transcriptional repressor
MPMDTTDPPDIVVGRLPHYLRVLQVMHDKGQKTTSSQELSQILGFSAAQIRKDLSQFGEFGKQGTGYSIPFLLQRLENILHINRVWEIALVGVGDLGHAIARYQGFARRGFHIAAIFDNDPVKIGVEIGGYTVQDISVARIFIPQNNIKIAMLTVPANAAQAIADELILAGIRAILSYAPEILILPADIQVKYIDPLTELQHMTYYLKE